MTSAIDATKPVAGTPTTQSVRDNFATAKSEITALQAAGATYLPLTGGTINGSPGSLVIGVPPGSSPSRGSLIANLNAAAPINYGAAGTALQIQGADGTQVNTYTTSFGAAISSNFLRANGTIGSPTAPTSGQILARQLTGGWTGAAWLSGVVQMVVFAGENWNASANGTTFQIATTPNGTTSATSTLQLDGGGNLTITGGTATKPGGGSWVAPSDPALKSNVTPYTDGLAAVMALEPIRYAYNGHAGTPDDGRQYVGLDAEAAAAAMPSLVGEMTYQPHAPNEEGELVPEGVPETYRTVDPSELVFTLINAVRELSDRLAALEAGR